MRPFLKQIVQFFLLLLQIYVGIKLIGDIITPNKITIRLDFSRNIIFNRNPTINISNSKRIDFSDN